MSLSTYIIAQNEEMDIAQAIESVKSISDEIILITDFNIDRTVDIAKSMGAKIVYFPESFDVIKDGWSKYENFAMNQCSKDWILKLDADEILTNPEVVKTAISKKLNSDVLLGVRSENVYEGHPSQLSWFPEAKHKIVDSQTVRRIWKNNGKERYVGFIHPTFNHETTLNIEYNLKHTSYSKPYGLRIRKSRFYSRLLLYIWDNPDLRAGLGENWFKDYIPKNMKMIRKRAANYIKFYETDYAGENAHKQTFETIKMLAQRDVRCIGSNKDITNMLTKLGFNFVNKECDTLICIDNYTDYKQCYTDLKDKGILILLNEPDKEIEKLFYPIATANPYVYIKRRIV